MGKYKAYPEYKDSGADWLGEVPVDWNVLDLKRHAWVKTGYAFSSESFVDDGEPIIRIGDIQQDGSVSLDGCKYIPSEQAKQYSNYLVYSGELLMAMTGATIGKAGWYKYDIPALVNQRVGVFKTDLNKLNYRFLWFVLKSSGYQEYIKLTAFGGAQPNISDIGMVGYKIVLPTLQEQEAIANFLDHETAKIDTLIEQQQQLIQLLKEKRQAVISHVVTKGLNPDAPMKDSGVEWLGEVPAHWVICRLKHIKSVSQNAFVDGPFGSNLKSEHFIDNGDVYVIESNFATTGEIDSSSLKTISNAHFETIKRSEATAGDIIIAKIGARFGMSSILPSLDKKSVVSGNSLKLTVNANVVTRMYAHKLLTVLKEMGAMDDGVNGSAQPALSLGELNNLLFLVPPIQEQSEIESFIQLNQDKFDVLLEKANVQVRLLQERRTALISAAVTGKIDVRNWQAPQ